MVTLRTALLAAVLSLGAAAPVSVGISASDGNRFDAVTSPVVYDLKAMWGDRDHDGKVTDKEYESFDISSLVQDKTKVTFLGFRPVNDSTMTFYVYSPEPFGGFTPADYQLSFANCPVQKEDGTYDDTVVSKQAELVGTPYFDGEGAYGKFVIRDYKPWKNDGDMRIVADRFFWGLKDEHWIGVADLSGQACELLYSGYGKDAVSTYFSDRTYSITGAVDMMLATEKKTVTSDETFFFIPVGKNAEQSYPMQAREIPYFFFDFDDSSFSPDQITEVTYQCYYCTFVQTHVFTDSYYLGDVSQTPPNPHYQGIYTGKYDDSQSAGSSIEIKEKSKLVQGTAELGDTYITQTDTWKGWTKHDPIVRHYRVPNIIRMSEIDERFAGDDDGSKAVRDFLKASDHSGYKWAYALQDSSWTRKVTSQDYRQTGFTPDIGAALSHNPVAGTYSRELTEKTLCHQPVNDSVVTLGMKVRKGHEEYSIRIMNEPLSVRDVYLVGLPAPTLADFIAHDASDFWAKYWWIFFVVAILAVLVLAAIFPAFLRFLKKAAKGIAYVLESLIVVLYFPFWCIIALVCRIAHKDIPKLWFWRKP